MEILTVRNLSKQFGSKKAVDDISFSVTRGAVMGLLGPNGAGKTTAIRMIMGILPADRGEVTFSFNGTPGRLDKSKVGYLPEERGLYYDVRVLDNLVYLSALKGKPAAHARREGMAWLKRLGLANYAFQKLEKLSKGMQQKVQFIASVLHQPQLVLFDEPFSGLDPVNQDFMKQVIRELQADGVTILLSAHQMHLVEELCDSIFLINHGREVLSGTLQDIKRRYKENTVELRFSPSQDTSFLKTIPGMRVLKEGPGEASLRYGGTLTPSELVQLLGNRMELQEITVAKPPLHEIFIETVKERGECGETAGHAESSTLGVC
ncbi:MAG: ATP-binding cassette domain-containing protein [Bacillota bacterium]